MSDGTRCIVRDLGLVKGGKGLKHHEMLLTLSVKGLGAVLLKRLLRAAPHDEAQLSTGRLLPRLSSLRRG